jgi:oligosaccharide repeat unit polymerase
MFIILSALYIVFAAAFLFWNLRRRWLFNPSALFVLQQLGFFLGILRLLNMGFPADVAHFAILCGTLVLFFAANMLSQHMHPVSQRDAYAWRAAPILVIEDGFFFNAVIFGVVAASILVCIYYYQQVGYNVFLLGVGAVLQGNEALGDIASMRLHTYAGSTYMAAGYVNQFKNTLLPLLTALLFARGILKRRRFDVFVALAVSPFCLAFLLGTGQRGPLFFAGLTAFAFFNATLPGSSRRRMNVVLIFLLGTLFAVTTLILGRKVSQVHSVSDVQDLAGDMIGRFTTDNQLSAVAAFRYVYDRDPQLLDGEYIHGLETLIPGHERKLALSNIVFQSMFGDSRGTAPASIWGTVWYDFKLPGAIVLALLLGYLYHYVYYVLIRTPKTLGRLATFCGVYVVLGMWAIGAPDSLLNNGLLALLILGGLFKLARRISGNDPGRSRKGALVFPSAGTSGILLTPGTQPLFHRENI